MSWHILSTVRDVSKYRKGMLDAKGYALPARVNSSEPHHRLSGSTAICGPGHALHIMESRDTHTDHTDSREKTKGIGVSNSDLGHDPGTCRTRSGSRAPS